MFLESLRNEAEVRLVGPMPDRAPGPDPRPTIYVDGGSRWRPPARESRRETSVGDGDSDPKGLDLVLPADKDQSDLAFALGQLPTTVTFIELFGFWGGRYDHQLAILGELHQFLKARAKAMARLAGPGDAFVAGFVGDFTLDVRGTFSLFTLEPNRVAITGACRFQLREPVRLEPLSSHGLSNVGHGPVAVRADGPVFIIAN